MSFTPLLNRSEWYAEHYLYNIFHKKCQTSFALTNMKKPESQMWKHTWPTGFCTITYIINDVCNRAIEIVKSVTLRDQKGTLENFFTFDCWGAIYNQHDFTKPHTHGPALWSWCYYIQVPNNAPPLYFREAKLVVNPKPDEIVIFPGHVTHEVPKASEMTEERIILAGNIYLDYRNT